MHVCIVGNPNWMVGGELGGAEKQLSELAKMLVKHGDRVSFIATQPSSAVSHGNLNVFPAWEHNRGIPGIRGLVGHRKTSLIRTLRYVNADIYYTRGISAYTHYIVKTANEMSKLSIVALANDHNISIGLYKAAYGCNGIIKQAVRQLRVRNYWKYGLRKATYIATQNSFQYNSIMMKYGNAIYIPNVISNIDKINDMDKDIDTIWIGRSTYAKGADVLERYVTTAKQIALVVGIDKCSAKNVTYAIKMPNKEIRSYIARSKILINTSRIEGFPNTFLEAWNEGIPVVSLFVNPNNLLSTKSVMGRCAEGNIEYFASLVSDTLNDKRIMSEEKKRIRREYVSTEHSQEVVLDKIKRLYTYGKRSNIYHK